MNGSLSRLGGAALVAGSVLLAGTNLLLRFNGGSDGDNPNLPVNIAGHGIGMLAGLLVILGLPALVAALSARSRALSVAGFVLVTVSILVYQVAFGLVDAVVLPYLAANHFNADQPPAAMFPFFMGAGFAEIIGTILLGVTILRSGVFSRISAVLLIAAGTILLVTLAPLPEWVDTISALAMLGGLGIAGAQMVGMTKAAQPDRRASLTAPTSA